MSPLLSSLIVVISIAGAILIASSLRLISRRLEERAARTATTRAEKLAQIPVVERAASYASIGLVIASVLAFRWAPSEGGADIRTLAFAVGVTALSYLVWFSVRWRHLK